MTEQSIEVIHPVVNYVEGKTMTTSLNIAEVFGKNHVHVIRSIRELDAPIEFSQSNFGLAEYKDEQGKQRPMYNITRDGFMLLAMGFTGKQAMRFKIAYIEAFNRMESVLMARKIESPPDDLIVKHEIPPDIMERVKMASGKLNTSNRLRLLHSVTQMSRVDQTMPHTRLSILIDYATMCDALTDDDNNEVMGDDWPVELALFIEHCCIRNNGAKIMATEIYDRFREFCNSRDCLPPSLSWFGRELGRRFKKHKSNGHILYEGVTLKGL